jgi:hypothetical protein
MLSYLNMAKNSEKTKSVKANSWVEQLKQHPLIAIAVFLGSLLAFISSFGKNSIQICNWLGGCAQETPSKLRELEMGQSQSFIQQQSVLGLPEFEGRDVFDSLLSDYYEERSGDFYEKVNVDGYDTFYDYLESQFESAQYRLNSLDISIRFKRMEKTVDAFLLEATRNEKCEPVNNLPMLSRILNGSENLCLAISTFKDFLDPNESGSIMYPGAFTKKADCWGFVHSGGSGGGQEIEVQCSYYWNSNSDPRFRYFIRVSSVPSQVGLPSVYKFDTRNEAETGSLEEFLRLVGRYPVNSLFISRGTFGI